MKVNINLNNFVSNHKINETALTFKEIKEIKGKKEIKKRETDKLESNSLAEINTQRQTKEKLIWDIQELKEIEAKLRNKKFPNEKIELASGVVIVDIQKFISSHLETCRNLPGKSLSLPCFIRLKALLNRI